MKKIEDFWVDTNNNKWFCTKYTKKQAELNSKTMIRCHGCCDCSKCIDCSICYNCSSCVDCRKCYDCIDCIDCHDCHDCSNCRNCIGCCDCCKQPAKYSTTVIGNRNEVTHFYFMNSTIMVRCGCFWDNLIKFTKQVEEVYPPKNKYRVQYLEEIKRVKSLWNQ